MVDQLEHLRARIEALCRRHHVRRLIAFRNVLIHGYAEVDDQLVWDLLQSHLPALIADVESLKG